MYYAQNRIDRLRASMATSGIDLFYIRDLSNIKWVTGFDGVFDDEDAHAVLVTEDQIILHTDSRYAQAAQDAAKKTSIQVDASVQTHAKALAVFIDRMKADGGEGFAGPASHKLNLGIESSMSLGDYRQVERVLAEQEIPFTFQETTGSIVALRSVKDAVEIDRMKQAQAITDAAFAHIIDYIRPGRTEREVQIELEDFMIRRGADGLAFASIVAAGANGASPHAIPGETILEYGQSLVLDFGARFAGYCSDMTRTVFLGTPDTTMKNAYAALRTANESVAAMLSPGITGKQAQECAEEILAQAGFEGTMGHSLGHGVGIDIHEEPVLAMRNEKPLEQGNVVTVEPGIYIPHTFGMRLEDFGVITEQGFDVFTQSTHDMVII